MKKILLLIVIALITYSSSFAIGGFKVAINKPGAAILVQVRIINYSPGGPTTVFTGDTITLTPNASGIIVADVPATPGILATDVNSFYVVNVYTGNSLTLVSQQRLDGMLFEQAQTGLTDNDGNLTIEPGKELKFPEPAGSGTNFTSFKSPTLAADVVYTLPINDGDANQYLKTDGSGIMSWDTPPTSPTGAAGGSLAGTYPNPTISAGAISNTELATNSVTTSKVADGTVTSAKIFDNTIVNADVSASAAIAYSKLNLNNSITNGDLTANSVTTSKVADGTITTAKISDSQVTTVKINDKAVTPAKIANGTAAGQVLTYNGTDAVWAAPAGGGGGGTSTFFLEFSSFENGSCCNDRSLNSSGQLAAAAGLFMNSTQPKPAYGKPIPVNIEVVSVSVYLNLTTKTLVSPVVFNVTPYIVNMTTGATDRALTAPIDLATLAEDQWHNISLSSGNPTDNLVDASADQYVMWELNSTHGGTEFDTEGVIVLRVEVKYP